MDKTQLKINLNNIKTLNKFVNIVTTFESDIDIISGRYICDAKSLMAVLSYDLTKAIEVRIHSISPEEISRFNEELAEFVVE